MGLFLSFKKNEGMCIKTPNGTIDIIVKDISKSSINRQGDFEIRGLPNRKSIHISNEDGLVELADDLYLGVRDGKYQKKDKLEIHFSSKKYRIEKKDYSC